MAHSTCVRTCAQGDGGAQVAADLQPAHIRLYLQLHLSPAALSWLSRTLPQEGDNGAQSTTKLLHSGVQAASAGEELAGSDSSDLQLHTPIQASQGRCW